MLVKYIQDEDFVNYKKCSMFIGFPRCTFKCDKENDCKLCQNSSLANDPDIEILIEKVYNRYITNPITKAIVIGGLEPFDTFDQLLEFIDYFRGHNCNDDIVIYTGYTEEEVQDKFNKIFQYNNLVIKYGRFRPNQSSHYDPVLGISLISDNQYSKQY